MKILLIEDEEAYLAATLHYFNTKGYLCEFAKNFKDAQEKIHLYTYDCIILDLRLPGGNGLDLLKQLKQSNPEAACIIASSSNTIKDKVIGLDIGSDDYISKPYDFDELDARIKALIRRKNFNGSTIITYDLINIDPSSRSVTVNHSMLNLTGKEYDLLILFIAHKDKMLSKQYIAESIWGDEMDQTDSYDFIYAHIKNLRKKLLIASGKDYLHTSYGMGYKFFTNE